MSLGPDTCLCTNLATSSNWMATRLRVSIFVDGGQNPRVNGEYQ